MPLESFISAVQKAKQHTVQKKRYDPSKPIPNLIDPTVGSQDPIKLYSPKPSPSTSINAIARDLEAKNNLRNGAINEVSWDNCLSLKRCGEKLFCLKFHALCAQSKCPKHVIEM